MTYPLVDECLYSIHFWMVTYLVTSLSLRNLEDSEVTSITAMEVTLFELVFHNCHWKLDLVMNLDLCSGLSDKLVLSLHGERRLECRKVV